MRLAIKRKFGLAFGLIIGLEGFALDLSSGVPDAEGSDFKESA